MNPWQDGNVLIGLAMTGFILLCWANLLRLIVLGLWEWHNGRDWRKRCL